jgi:transcriptional regulator with XRE-family HTH domain
MDIGRKLKTLRTSRGFEPIDIAEKLGISKSTYGRYERNETVPDLNMLEKISKEYEITISDLLSDDRIVFSSEQKGGTSNNALIINQLSEKLIEQFEIRIKEKDETILFLKSQIKN